MLLADQWIASASNLRVGDHLHALQASGAASGRISCRSAARKTTMLR
jgi:hypothetical protein